MTVLPEYTKNKMKGNIGEALVQYLLSHFCLVHKIDGSNDVGNDFICELIKDRYPTNLLFYVQVKFSRTKPRIKPATLEYWKGSPIPVYIFWIRGDPPTSFLQGSPLNLDSLEKKYIRMTPKLHNATKHRQEEYKVFTEENFKRDLVVDYARTQYQQGLVPLVEPRDFLTLDEKQVLRFPQYQLLIKDVIPEYKQNILRRGWVQPLVIASLLLDEDRNLETRVIVEYSITLAELQLARANPGERVQFEVLVHDLR